MEPTSAEKIKAAAASRKVQRGIDWKCTYCGKSFATEKAWTEHDDRCPTKLRFAELKTPIGQAGYQYYCEWMKLYKRRPPSAETFSDSRYYKSFIQFAEHVNRIGLPDAHLFIKIMVDRDISPQLWRRDQCYTMYLQYVDQKLDPIEQVTISVETLLDISTKEIGEDASLEGIYEHLGIRRIIELIKLRQLSPWLLFCSSSFGPFLRTVDEDDSTELASIVNPTYWSDVLQQNMKVVEEIKAIATELGL